jgi:NADH-quinone oxidoreductase subunit L
MIWLVPLCPLVGVLLNGFLGPRLGRRFVSVVGPAVVLAAFGISIGVLMSLLNLPPEQRARDVTLYQWITVASTSGPGGGAYAHSEPAHSLDVPFGFRIDPLSVTMILVVTGVGFLIHLYSTGYMAEDPLYARYFTYLNLFTFSMLLLVLANNFVLMFVGWEGVGLCSYLLIGFWFQKVTAAAAGKKAFILNRVGDWGFLVGIMLLFWELGTLTFGGIPSVRGVFDEIAAKAATPGGVATLTSAALLLFLGAAGKSAQLPLYLWLPDAMEGPTPVSALIHAATMVTAGVYMVARCHVLFDHAPTAALVVAVVGTVTALFAATVALVQYDIKRVLAYSTVSQLGYMFLGVGVGAYTAGIFHLVTHAFFKALMFLGAGSVIHALSGEQDMRRMGGLWKHLPLTFWTFLFGYIAISGIPPFAGFYSKDAILSAAYEKGGMYQALYWVGLGTAALTAFYMGRMFFTTFLGPERLTDEAKHHLHESPPVMTGPLMVLGLLSIVGGGMLTGWLPLGHGSPFTTWLAPAVQAAEPAVEHVAQGGLSEGVLIGLSVAAGALGILAAWLLSQQGAFLREKETPVRELVEARYGYDSVLHAIFVRGGSALAMMLWTVVDVGIIDGIVNGVAGAVNGGARALRTLQTGYVRNYALEMLAGATVVVIAFLWWLK